MSTILKMPGLWRALAALGAVVAVAVWIGLPGAGGLRLSLAKEAAVSIPAPTVNEKAPADGKTETAVVAGGCFWGVQGVYQHVKGVQSAVSGYAGGDASTAHYEIVGSGMTGHAESVEVVYDPKQISYGEILRIFFSVVHDPTQLNRQGPDSGTQYRSEIFTTTPEQERVAKAYIEQLDAAKVYGKRIVTKVEPLKKFYAAEGYHQDYLILHPNQPYIAYNDIPKVENLKREFPSEWQDKPVTVTSVAKAQ